MAKAILAIGILLGISSFRIDAGDFEKTRIQIDQVQEFQKKLFIWDETAENWNLIEYISWDEEGCYAKLSEVRGPCGLHQVWKVCGGCGVLLCPMNCTCFD